MSDEKDDKKKIITFYDTLDILVFTKNNDLIRKMETLRDIGQANEPILGQIIEKSTESANLMGF